MATLRPCPDRRDLEQFLLGHGDPASATGLEDHLSTCPTCATAAGQLSAEDELVSSVRKAVSTHATPEPKSVESLVSAFRLAARESDGRTISYSGANPPSDAPTAEQVPTAIGGYEVRGVLGRGGMGVVFHAFDRLLRREVAIKVVKREWRRSKDAVERFLAEARAVAAVEHDNIVVVHAVEMHDGHPCLVMPLLKGEPLSARLGTDNGPPLSVEHLTSLARDVLGGLVAAHAIGLIHRDIKPGNLWVESSRGFGRVKILDFGLAVAAEQEGIGMGGTPGFMPPEQIHGGAIDPRADLFAVGCVLYRAATGRQAFDGKSSTDRLVRTITRDPQPVRELNPAIPPRLAAFIERLLAKEPADRVASATAALDELTAIEAEVSTRRRRTTRRAWLAGVAFAATAGGLAAWFLNADPPPVAVEITHDPDITKLILSRDGREQVVELPKGAKLSLVPGEYTVKLPADVPGRRLEPASFTILPDTPAKVTVSLPGEVAVSKAHDGAVTGVAAFAGKGKGAVVVVSASLDRTLNSWTVGSADEPTVARLSSPARAFAATPDGKVIITAGGNKQPPTELGVQVWDGPSLTDNGPPLDGHTRMVNVAAVAADGSRIVTASASEVWLRSPRQSRREELIGHGEAKVTAAAVDATGKFALTGDDAGNMILWDAATASLRKKVLAQGVGAVGAVRAVGFTTGGIVSTGDDGVIRVWDATTFKARELTPKGEAKPQLCLAVSADGKRLVCGGADGVVSVWSVTEGRVLTTFTGHQGAVNAVAFTPDGTGAVSGGADRTVRVWRLPLP